MAAVAPANATARAERTALCDLLLQVGPEAPTCCAGWTTRDLAAHLVIRERRPDAGLGVALAPLAGWTARVQRAEAARAWSDLVERVRTGPPRYTPAALPALDGAMNTVEFFVHHEDVRRARPQWTPRTLPASATDQLWTWLIRGTRLIARRSPVGIVAEPTDGPGGRQVLRPGARAVTLRGPVGELTLAVWGRPTSGLEVLGDPADVAAFHEFPR